MLAMCILPPSHTAVARHNTTQGVDIRVLHVVYARRETFPQVPYRTEQCARNAIAGCGCQKHAQCCGALWQGTARLCLCERLSILPRTLSQSIAPTFPPVSLKLSGASP